MRVANHDVTDINDQMNKNKIQRFCHDGDIEIVQIRPQNRSKIHSMHST